MPRPVSAGELLTQVELAVLAGRNLTQVEAEVLAWSGLDEEPQAAADRAAQTAPGVHEPCPRD
jgi:uncharacterized protein with NRDE domain